MAKLTLILGNDRREKKCSLKYSNISKTKMCIYMGSTGNNILGNLLTNILYAKYIYKYVYILI